MAGSKLFDLTNKKALITGAASGLGRAMAIGLAEAGTAVAVADINLEKARETAKEIKNMNQDAFAIQVDVSQSSQVNEIVLDYGY